MAFGQSVIKSIQRGTITVTGTSNTATITAVDVDKSVVLWGGNNFQHATAHDERAWNINLVLTNSTTVTADRGPQTIDSCIVPFQVLEYN